MACANFLPWPSRARTRSTKRAAAAGGAGEFGDEVFGVAVVGPGGRTEQGHFQGGVVFYGVELFRVEGLIVAGEEHGFAFAEGDFFGEQGGADGAELRDGRRPRAGGDGLAQGGFSGVEIGQKLDAGHVERVGSFIEAMAFAIFGEHVADVEVGQLQEIAEVLFVLVAIEAAEGGEAARWAGEKGAPGGGISLWATRSWRRIQRSRMARSAKRAGRVASRSRRATAFNVSPRARP